MKKINEISLRQLRFMTIEYMKSKEAFPKTKPLLRVFTCKNYKREGRLRRNEGIANKDTKTTTVGYLTRPRLRSALEALNSLASQHIYNKGSIISEPSGLSTKKA